MKIRFLVLFFCLLAASAWSAELKGSCQIDFTGTSTLHDFSGTAACEPFSLVDSGESNGALKLVGESIRVQVAGMDTDNKKRDKKMRSMFDAAQFPEISGRIDTLTPATISKLAGKEQPGTLSLHLKIRDIDLPQTARVNNIHEDETQLDLELELELSLKAYQLEPPSVLGLIRVGDLVKVRIHFLLDKIGAVPKHLLS